MGCDTFRRWAYNGVEGLDTGVMISLGTGEENRAVVEAYGLAFPVLEGSGEVRASCLSALLNCDPCGWIEFTAKNAKGAKIFYFAFFVPFAVFQLHRWPK